MADPLLERLLASIEAGQSVALVTVVKASGRLVDILGKRALVWPDRVAFNKDWDLGPLEARIVQDARDCLSRRQPQLLTYAEGELEIFVEVQRRPPTLIIVGAGHVAVPLAQLGKMIDFEVVVLDDRPLYANQKRFPMADRVLVQPFAETLRQWPIDEDTFLVLVTRGHSHDVESLLEVINSPARYIGMIGSKRRVKAVFELLESEKGVDPAKLERVYAPIGLDIGAESPAEIAIGVIAEIINVYRGGRAVSLSDALRTDRRLALHPARGKKAD
jgi:xanthine dehydrogenase accessory factor